MKNVIIICLASISLVGCNRSACDCMEDKTELNQRGSDALSRGDNNTLKAVLTKISKLEEDCAKFTKEDYDKCK